MKMWQYYFLGLCFSLWGNIAYATQYYPINEFCQVVLHQVNVAKAEKAHTPPKDGWQAIDLPDRWDMRWKNYNQGVWYKLKWDWQCQSGYTLDEPIVFALDHITSAGAVYINHDLLWKDNALHEPLSRSWNMPRYWALPARSVQEQNNEIQIYVTGFSFQAPGLGDISFNNFHDNYVTHQRKIWERRTIFQINLVVSTVFGIICLIIWLFRRTDITFGWFALSTLFWLLFVSNMLITETAPFPSSLILAKLNVLFFMAYALSFCAYLVRFMSAEAKIKKIEKWILILSTIWLSLLIFSPLEYIRIISSCIFIFYLGVIGIHYCFLLHKSLLTKQVEYILLSACLSLIMLVLIIDMVMLLHPTMQNLRLLTPYSVLMMNLFIIVVLAMRLTQNAKKVENFPLTLEAGIQHANHELGLNLGRQHKIELENVRLQERINLSHDLHDGLGASLVRSMEIVDRSEKELSNQQFMSILKLLRDDLRQIIDTGSAEGTQVPNTPILWVLPVKYRFSQLMDELGIHSKWAFPEQWKHEPLPFECLTLIRVCEESLINVIKHSRAKNVIVEMRYLDQDTLFLVVQDDGLGFDADGVLAHGMSIGMRSMQLRLQQIGATLKVESRSGCTKVQATLKLSPE